MFLVGLLNLFQGMVLISADEIYVSRTNDADVVIGDAGTWGWVIIVVGVLEMLAGAGVFSRNQMARWFGIVASLALLAQFPVFFGTEPLLSFFGIVLCAMVIHALAVYGSPQEEPA